MLSKYSSIEEQKNQKVENCVKRSISITQEKYIYSLQNWKFHKPQTLNFQLFIEYTPAADCPGLLLEVCTIYCPLQMYSVTAS